MNLFDARNGWCILRTGGQRTIPVARSLAGAGLKVWTPVEVKDWRRPRSKEVKERELAIMPTFVFVRADQINEVRAILSAPVSPHPPFSIFTWGGKIPVIADRSIASIRSDEEMKAAARSREMERRERDRLRKQRFDFPEGSSVTAPDQAAFVGLTGVVEACDGKQAVVIFGGALRVEIATWMLQEERI